MRIRYAGKMWDVELVDDGTLDTVVSVNGLEYRYDGEGASVHRDTHGRMTKCGLRALACDVIDNELADAFEPVEDQ